MRAIVQDRYGSADVLHLGEIDKPNIGARDVLVRVRAAGIHIGDWHLMAGRPYLLRLGFGLRRPRARVRGMDVAGTVEAVGEGVTRFKVGDQVYGVCDGSFAEYASTHEEKIALKPTNLSFEQAAAVPTSACTALQALRDMGEIKAGQRVLIVGASGGVGLFAVQIAKAFGAEVTGLCSAAKMDLVRAVGADHVVDYGSVDITQSAQRYDLILDMAGTHRLSHLRRILTERGTLVVVGGEGGGPWFGVVDRLLRALVLSRFVSQRLRPVMGTTTSNDLRVLDELVEAGKVAPIVDRTYPLDQASDAMRYLVGRRARGKVVISM